MVGGLEGHARILDRGSSLCPSPWRRTPYRGKPNLLWCRHPWEIIASAVRYHLRRSEAWTTASPTCHVHFPHPGDDHRSYYQRLASLGAEDRLIFEMEQCSGITIYQMYKAIRANQHAFVWRLESCYSDSTLEQELKRLCSRFGLRPAQRRKIRAVLKRPRNATTGLRRHTFEGAFTPRVAKRFYELFPPDIFEVLPYPAPRMYASQAEGARRTGE